MHIYNNKTRTLWLIIYFFFRYINRLHTSQNTIRTYRKRRKLLEKKALRELDEDTGYYSQKIIPAAIYKLACSIFE